MRDAGSLIKDQALLKYFCETGISWIDHSDQNTDMCCSNISARASPATFVH